MLLWTELQPPYTVLVIFVALYTLVSLPLVWGYIVVNLACGYLYGLVYGMTVTVLTATVGIALAHVLCKVDKVFGKVMECELFYLSTFSPDTSSPASQTPSSSGLSTPSSRGPRHSR